MILFSCIPRTNCLSFMRLIATIVKTGTAHTIWIRITADGSIWECIIMLETCAFGKT